MEFGFVVMYGYCVSGGFVDEEDFFFFVCDGGVEEIVLKYYEVCFE